MVNILRMISAKAARRGNDVTSSEGGVEIVMVAPELRYRSKNVSWEGIEGFLFNSVVIVVEKMSTLDVFPLSRKEEN